MEKQEFALKLPLKQLALRKLAIVLWTGSDIKNLIKEFRYEFTIDDFQIKEWRFVVEKKVEEKLSLFVLPEAMRKELIYALKPIGPEILKWKMHHQSLLTDPNDFLDHLSWTSVGSVDYRETAKKLVKLEQIEIIRRYHLACVYCLDDDIPQIYKLFPENDRKRLYSIKWPLQSAQAQLVLIWTRILEGNEIVPSDGTNRNRTFDDYAFLLASHSGYEAATKHFFSKLTLEVKTANLRKATQRLLDRAGAFYSISIDFPKEKFCDVLCFLLSQMDKEEQMEVFKKNAYTCLLCFLNWPWQDLFMKVAELSWAYLSKENFLSLMTILASNGSITGCYFPELFGELFLNAPSDFKEYIMRQNWESGLWFKYLFYSNRTESIKLVIRSADASDRQKFILCENGLSLCRKLIDDRKWFLLELFIAECALSEEAKAKLKSHFTKFDFLFREGRGELRERFFHLINTANVEDCGKRCSEDMQIEDHEIREKPIKRRKFSVGK